MDRSDRLLCLFSARIEERGGSYVIDLPDREFDHGDLRADGTVRVAILPTADGSPSSSAPSSGHDDRRGGNLPRPPVSEGDRRDVEIDDVGEQGDGLARVERGYIVFVPGTQVGDRVTIEITDVRENFAFGEAVDEPGGGSDSFDW